MSFEAVSRRHAADQVFDQLAAAVISGEFALGASLPPERVLSERFACSPLIIRQAIHRLAELGLCRVRQGGATVVLDPYESADVRVIALLYGAGVRTKRDVRDVVEKQMLQGFCLVEIAARRASDDVRREALALVEELAASEDPERAWGRFDELFWSALARGGQNRIYALEVAWWYRALARRPAPPASPIGERVAFYREIARRLVAHKDAAGFYLRAIQPVLAALDGRTPPSTGGTSKKRRS
jgi:GntR family transcriptional repressor for pyruvate dehydrogenase complex